MSKRKKRRSTSQPTFVKPQAAFSPGAAPAAAPQPAPTQPPTLPPRPLARPLAAALVALFLVTRLVNLDSFPLHGDEGAYIYWGQIAASGPEQRFISMWGGRQPLHTWIVAALVPLVDYILVPARLISVAAGAFTALGVYLLARKLFSTRVAFVATLFYLLSPYTVQFDRQVFQDGMISAEAIWTLYLTLLTFERPRWPISTGMGLLVGAALLTKSTSWLFLPLIIFCFLPFPRAEWKARALKAAPHLAVALAIGGAIYYVLFGSSPAAADLGHWASIFTYSVSELLGFPFDAWGRNAESIIRWLATYLTLPVFLLTLAAFEATVAWLMRPDPADPTQFSHRPTRSFGRKALLIAIWGTVPILAHVILAKGLYARYIVFAIPPLLILVAILADRIGANLAQRSTFSRFKPSSVTAVVVALLAALPAYQTALLLFAPQNFNFDAVDRAPYYDGALWARVPLADYLRATYDGRPTTLLTNFGMNNVLMEQLVTQPRSQTDVRLAPLWPVNNDRVYPFDPYTLQPYPPETVEAMRQTRVLYGTLPGEEGPLAPFLTPLADFPDRTGQTQVRLYAVDFERYLAWLSQ